MSMLRIRWSSTLALAGLVACGGGGDPTPARPDVQATSRIVVFGDSLSDSGTYALAVRQLLASQVNPAFASAPAGKYTDSPGPIWVETLAQRLGISISNERFEWGTGSPLAATNRLRTEADATNYSQGGSRVSGVPGVGCQPNGAGDCTFQAAVPSKVQIDRALAKGNFQPTDLVLYWSGSNDVLFQRTVALTAIAQRTAAAEQAAGRPLTEAELSAIRTAATAEGVAQMEQAARDAVAQLKRLQAAGAQRLVALTIPNVASTPLGLANVSNQRPLLQALSEAFNTRFKSEFNAQFTDPTRAYLFDAGRNNDVFYADPVAIGLPNRDVPVCNVPAQLGNSALFCFKGLGNPFINPAVKPEESMFADGVHPSLAVHAKLAQAVYDALKDRDWIR